ncbi:exodeoxyribonuclease V subunit beta [Vibrio parahaemolyticus]|uniref:RecBCD enzyme subunit RecB n=1 Tax=Vibrio parahaemolyticus TaxID=670 RepID=A0AAW8PZA6_VIBPH|nr:exodeoxyribonuclease V subunit beta [Vibrio parahaemolyticus]MDS1821598.1 exodeoxyribonuclease V subunit beta [Vibrio parahaemolyticus]
MTEKEKTPVESLNPLSFPLYGARLIEASAGTGKTFTICSLYLRLLLGHGAEDSRHQYPLTVDQILVVTFTEAATEELRSRIRTRIKEARYAFLKGSSNDPLLSSLLSDTINHELAAELLLQAERQMDEAAVFTIHGFCQRMLVNSAFESGSLFETSFLTDESKLRQQVVSDYWRIRFNNLPSEVSSIIRSEWKNPAALLKDINSYLSGAPVYIKGTRLSGDIIEAHDVNIDRINELKKSWLDHKSQILDAFDSSDVNRRSYTKKSLPEWISKVTQWAETETTDYSCPAQLEKFRAKTLQEKSKNSPPELAIFNNIEDFYQSPIGLTEGIMKDAIEQCRTLLKEAKERIYVLAFDDLLTQLSDALKGEQGKVLGKRIREMYPIAMIDEFQDTDPLQYNIFSSIYRTRLCQSVDIRDSGIFMIGDPKQAIYGFRGADIFTYIKARREVNSHFTLSTNWRSTSRMINAVNSVFMHSPSPFIYNDDIEFRPALFSDKSTENAWVKDGNPSPAITMWLDKSKAEISSKKDYVETMTEATVQQIKELLTDESIEVKKGESTRRVKAGDIAILVRTSDEAKVVRAKLSEQNIQSVYLSNRESVFSTMEAHDILRILVAMSDPTNDRVLKPALATHLLGEDAESLVEIEHNEHKLEDIVLEFSEYSRIWEKKGVMPALRQILITRKISERLLRGVEGERKVADFLHVCELLQEESQKTQSKHGLIRWLTEKIEEPDGNAEEQQVRLESESDLVKVITIHKSKGLEYNFVFLPFLTKYRESDKSLYHDETKSQTVLDTKKSDFSKSRAEKERLAEDLRLLYVGLTRAVYGLWIGLTPIADGRKKTGNTGVHKSAIGWLLQKGTISDAQGLIDFTNELENSCDDIFVCPPPLISDTRYEIDNLNQIEIVARTNKRNISENWYVTSFSALSANSHRHKHVSAEFTFEEEQEEVEVPELDIFSFHKGAKAGTFLHTVFENIDYSKPNSLENEEVIKELLFLEGYEIEWTPVVKKLTEDILTKPMTSEKIELQKVTSSKLLCEMEFAFPIKNLNATKLANLAKKHDPISKDMDLNFFDVSGMLKGFIDLTFEYEGKYYVLDWKSNHLGDNHDAYTIDALIEAMQDHRYDLQYQIYSLALHKYLKTRVKDYSYNEHFGGVLYVFLRGVNSDNNNGIYFARPSEEFLNGLTDLFKGEDA